MPGSAEKYQQQRQQAISSAASVFADKGYHGSSTTDIAEHLGIKQGSLYYYFKSKEEALAEVCMLAMGDYARQMDEIAASRQPFEAMLIACITAHISKYREQNAALKVYHAERLYLPVEKREKLHELGSGYRQKLEGIFEQGIRAGAVRESTDCHFAAQAVIGMCNAWGELMVRDPGMDMFDVIQKCNDMLCNGFLDR
jgi:AcrR family transcriptional regulator